MKAAKAAAGRLGRSALGGLLAALFGLGLVRLLQAARDDEALHPAALELGHAADEIHHQLLATDVGAPGSAPPRRHHGDGVGLHVEDAAVAGGGLLLGLHHHAAGGLQLLDLAATCAGSVPVCGVPPACSFIEPS